MRERSIFRASTLNIQGVNVTPFGDTFMFQSQFDNGSDANPVAIVNVSGALFLTQSIWAGSYVGMKLAGQEMPVGLIVFLRYGLASLLLLSAAPWNGLPRLDRRDWLLVAFLGALNFALAPTLQISSLKYTQAIDVSILIALEPPLTVLLATLALRERPSGTTIRALAVGTLGMLILSGVGFSSEVATAPNRLLGNVLFTASLLCEASVTAAGGRLARRYPASHSVLAMKAAGFLTAAVVFAPVILSADVSNVSWKGWASVIFLAVLHPDRRQRGRGCQHGQPPPAPRRRGRALESRLHHRFARLVGKRTQRERRVNQVRVESLLVHRISSSAARSSPCASFIRRATVPRPLPRTEAISR